ncbi:hypothetical protein JWG39_03105 [Desulforhopalus vacuolatus]|uniref:hypothetical protein n=1 Tax=Desulforhopalus vacuolatus TaxID=40414 RepID=UPI001962F198|nr:hypothetical protein [Desulforhopalus vacuolatus]MBM9518806.1 hypothetical protein [Desulforhopalus vacuolatus]
MFVHCETCGNRIRAESAVCPFCGSKQTPGGGRKKFRRRTINLKYDLPTVEDALQRMTQRIGEAKHSGITLLVLIHGYGSSGRGGSIRVECRKVLDYQASLGEIGGYLAGEAFSQNLRAAKHWLQRYPKLAESEYLNRGNQGITLVFLR